MLGIHLFCKIISKLYIVPVRPRFIAFYCVFRTYGSREQYAGPTEKCKTPVVIATQTHTNENFQRLGEATIPLTPLALHMITMNITLKFCIGNEFI